MSLKSKSFSTNEFFSLLYSYIHGYSTTSIYLTLQKLSDMFLDQDDFPILKKIERDTWRGCFFMTLPLLGWTVVLMPDNNHYMYNIGIMKYRFINSDKDFDPRCVYIRLFISDDTCLETEMRMDVDENLALLLKIVKTRKDALILYSTFFECFIGDLFRSAHMYYIKHDKEKDDIIVITANNSGG